MSGSRLAVLLALAAAGAAFAKTVDAQVIGGRYAYGFLRLPVNASTTALGGWRLVDDARDPALAQWNPASLNRRTDRVVHLGQDFVSAGVTRSSLAGGLRLDRYGIDAAAHLQYVGFGDFTGRDEAGVRTGDFAVRGYTAGVTAAREVFERLRVGAGLSVVHQQIESFGALGISLSGGLIYAPDTSGRTLIGLQFQHLGTMVSDFGDGREPLPTDVSLALTRRLKYLPLRFGIVYRKLDRWNLLYDDPDRRDAGGFGEAPTERSALSRGIDNFGRHLGFNVELGLGAAEAFRLRVGYDRQRQAEGLVEGRDGNYPSLAGFSGGLGFDFRRGQVNYGYRVQHQGGGGNHLTLLLDLSPPPRAAPALPERTQREGELATPPSRAPSAEPGDQRVDTRPSENKEDIQAAERAAKRARARDKEQRKLERKRRIEEQRARREEALQRRRRGGKPEKPSGAPDGPT